MHARRLPSGRRLLYTLIACAALAPPGAALAGDAPQAVDGPDMRILATPPDVHFRVRLGERSKPYQPRELEGARGWSVRLAPRRATQPGTWPSPATDGERVFVGGPLYSSMFYAVDAATGRVAWKASLEDNGPTPAVVRDRRVYFNTQSCTLYAYDARSGRRIWSRYLAGSLQAVPTLAGGNVLSPRPHRFEREGTADQGQAALTVLDAADGRVLADVTIDGDGIGAPVVRGDRAYVATRTGALYCIDLAAAETAWTRPIGASAAPWVDDTGIYVRCGTRLDRLDPVTGASYYEGAAITPSRGAPSSGTPSAAPRRRPELPADDLRTAQGGFWQTGPGPVVAARRLCMAAGRTLRLYAPSTGRSTALWELDVQGAIVGSPCVAGDTIVVATDAGEVRAVDARDGEIVWAADLSARLAGGVALDAGRLFATTTDGRLVCVEVGDLRADGWRMWGGSPTRSGD